VFASEIDRKMYHIKAHDLFSESSADPNQMLYIIFYSIIDHINKTKESCIIFLDEIEKIIHSMGEYSPAEQKMIANTILKNIINIQKSNLDITVIAALGHKNRIDPRFMKYDIFDNQFFFELPGTEERKKLFQLYMQKAEKRAKLKLFDQSIMDDLVKKTEGLSAEHIKQLVNSCVKEYLYSYLSAKASFDIDTKYILHTTKFLKALHTSNPTKKKVLPREERQKMVSTFMLKYQIFGVLDTKEKADIIKNCILDSTKRFSEADMGVLFNMLLDAYQNRKTEYHRKSLIQKDFIMDKIQELRTEEKRKGNSSYLSNK
jgi:SpoVK/Ycf46/Vps4 family AAA+-type ATPase